MSDIKIDQAALRALANNRRRLSPQQFRTLRGQVLAGDSAGALRGLDKILKGGRCS